MIKTIALGIAIILIAIGCGGSGSGTTTPSPFEGSYMGAYQGSVNNDSGTGQFAIAANGSATGSWDDVSGLDGVVSGSIGNNGSVDVNINAQGQVAHISGTVTLTGNSLTGTLNETGATNQTVTINLTKS